MSDVAPELTEAGRFAQIGSITTGRGAVSGIAASSDGAVLALNHYGDDSVSLADTRSGRAALTVTDVREPGAVAVSGNRAYVSSVSTANDEILVLDVHSERIVAVHSVAFGVTDVAVSADGRFVYAGCTGAHAAGVAMLDTVTGARRFVAVDAATVNRVRVSPDGRRLYVAANSASTAEVAIVDTRQGEVVGSVEIGSPICDIALSHDGVTLFVGSCGPDLGTVLDVVDVRRSTVTATDKIGDAAGMLTQVAVSRRGERVYLVGDNFVTVWSTASQEVLGRIEVGDRPSCVTESPDGARLYVADYAGTVTELSIAGALPGVATPDDVDAEARRWAFSDLPMLEPTLV